MPKTLLLNKSTAPVQRPRRARLGIGVCARSARRLRLLIRLYTDTVGLGKCNECAIHIA